ncbi:Malate/L-lactate dehydrogenase [Exophiala viscosa]|uniref:Malate/L-lactate dehydrogenase n=1 Tax=Exophiala viscosa TaxID=2486360 RepID=A0AAN6IEL2_9EURO|nr:Malate/L-lactate dehydrogenase [Exophiala viscosa]KAI1625742.1 Malate/L-lactate dehydrogenase [Exophiala viscosa]
MKIALGKAEDLASRALQKIGYDAEDTKIITHHLIDSELRGYGIAGLARILSIADRLSGKAPLGLAASNLTKDSPTSALLEGNDVLGYLVAHKATSIAIEKAKASGVAAVSANGTYYTGMLSYYAEMAAAEDLVTIIASNASPWVAPEGTYKGLLGTNPFCIGVPSEGVPIIYDIGTSRIIHAQAVLAKRKGEQLPPNTAFDEHGEMTTDPDKALKGALAVWGGAKGTGLAIAVQLLGIMAGSPAMPPDLADFGYFVMVIDPSRFRQIEDFKREVGNLITAFHDAPTLSGDTLRMPFERSNRVRAEARAGGQLEVDDIVIQRLEELIAAA